MKQNTHIRIGIVADDLTSATDGAAPFLAKGYVPLIARRDADLKEEALVSIDTNSRALTAMQAAIATAGAVSALNDRPILFKTIDSTLRGHIREEIAAAFRESGRSRLIIAPAFPGAGRMTLRGIQPVKGIPVSESDYGNDPVHPARTAHIADLIDASLGAPIVLAKDDPDKEVRGAANARVVILDADSQQALNKQVARIPDPDNVLWAGSPGLAIALAALVPAAPVERSELTETSSRVLIVAGSANPVAHAQCDALRAQQIPVVGDLAEVPADARVICLRAPLRRQSDAAVVLADIAGQAASALAHHTYDTVIATGGETMAAILDRLGITGFVLTCELESGFPVGRTEQADGTPLTIAMKAGGFGLPSTLLRAAEILLPRKGPDL